MRTTFLFLSLLTSLTLLVACSGQPGKPSSDQEQMLSSAERIQQLLNEAQNSDSPLRERQQLRAAALLLSEQQLDLTEKILADIDPGVLPISLFGRYTATLCRLQVERGNYQQALATLETPRLMENMDALSPHKQISLSLLRAEVFALLGSHIASAQQRIYINPLLAEQDRPGNREGIWRSLMYVPVEKLETYRGRAFGEEYRGWLELALIGKVSQGDLDAQVLQLERWQLRWPTHPASLNLPGGLELIKELAASRPQQVALLLPLSGKLAPFGKAVRDGFLAAMYQTRQQGGKVPQIKVYDTEANSEFIALYYRAVDAGAEMIIGPLDKQRLRLLFDEVTLPVTTLGLNRIDDYGQAPPEMFQFGLAPQDEARQIAEIAFLENRRRALIITPRGEWGDKVSGAFAQHWLELGAEAVTQSLYSGQQDYSSSIKDSLLLADSEARARRIGQLVKGPLEFSPRRREDIDMVFLLARPQQARSIKPLLAYHYAGDLPVYGTSRLYAGFEDIGKDTDINGVRFTDMPWILNAPSQLHNEIALEINQSKPYQRMYALGVDCFQVYPRLRQLDEIANSRVYGETGTLKLNERKEIERQMLYAQIKRARATIIPTADQSLNFSETNKHQAKEGQNDDQKMDKEGETAPLE